MFDVNRIDSCFPFNEFRQYQKESIADIVKSFNSADVYLLSAPVGFGKSPVGICLARMTDNKIDEDEEERDVFGAYYLSPQNMLVDQLEREQTFKQYINIIKGREHYSPCQVPGFGDKKCSEGQCQVKDRYDCEYFCNYKKARNAARDGQIAVSNFVYMIMVNPYIFGERQLLVVDEAHSVADWGLGFVTCTLWQRDVGNIPVFKNFDEYIGWLGKVYEKFETMVKDIKEELKKDEFVFGLKERKDKLEETVKKIKRLLDDYAEFHEEWIFTVVDVGSSKERIRFEPVTAGRFLDKLVWWRGQKKLLMSGTIFPELFVEEAGLTNKVVAYKEVPSSFPVENRPIYYWPAGRMSKDYKDLTMPVMKDRILNIMYKNLDKKGLVHCHSYDIANGLYKELSEISSVLMPKGGIWLQNKEERDQSLREWMESKDASLYLSVNRTEGLDLKDDLCRYQINAKVQFPYMGDKRVKARMNMVRYACNKCGRMFRASKSLVDVSCSCGGILEMNMKTDVYTCKNCGIRLISLEKMEKCGCGGVFDKNTVICDGGYWYDMQAIIDLVQSYGRGVRSETDFCSYWLLDGSFMPLYKKRYTSFPKFFKEAVRVVK